jgi:hypothetical protein
VHAHVNIFLRFPSLNGAGTLQSSLLGLPFQTQPSGGNGIPFKNEINISHSSRFSLFASPGLYNFFARVQILFSVVAHDESRWLFVQLAWLVVCRIECLFWVREQKSIFLAKTRGWDYLGLLREVDFVGWFCSRLWLSDLWLRKCLMIWEWMWARSLSFFGEIVEFYDLWRLLLKVWGCFCCFKSEGSSWLSLSSSIYDFCCSHFHASAHSQRTN